MTREATENTAKPIGVGDLVQAVRPADCGCAASIGEIFTVESFKTGEAYCVDCKKDLGAYTLAFGSSGKWFGVHRLKRIHPLSELEGEKRDEEITA